MRSLSLSAVRWLPATRRASGVLALASTLCAPALGQSVSLVPTLTVEETLTDNRDLSATSRRADLITKVSPGLSLTSRQGALRGTLNYAFNGVLYAQDSSLNSVYHSLAGTGKLSLADGRAGIDVSANAGRQVISAFGTQSASEAGNRGNQAQVLSYSLTPYLSGRLLGDVDYRVRFGYAGSRSDVAYGGDPVTLESSANLSGRLVGLLGWGVDASRQQSRTDAGPRTQNSRLTGSLNYAPDIEWMLTARAGWETDNTRTGQSERTTSWGAGVAWSPGPRSIVRLNTDRRFFGQSHSVTMSHRMARTVWTYSDSRSLDSTGLAGRAVLSNYEYYSQLFASLPEAIRDTVVRDYLVSRNLDPSGRATSGGFLSNGPTVQRSQNLSMAYQGLRATFTVTAFQTRSKSASETSPAGGDLANGNSVNQRGLSASWSHRLTPDASIVVSASQQKTPGAGAQPGNDLKSITATWSARLGRKSNVTLGIRHSQFDSDINPYQESAVIGSVRMQF